jgi:hypothetical protein
LPDVHLLIIVIPAASERAPNASQQLVHHNSWR